MQTLNVTIPQGLRAQIQRYQTDSGIESPEQAITAALEAYFQTWTPTRKTSPLPAMYDAEDGPCEVIESFL